jgi:hypothetical protein
LANAIGAVLGLEVVGYIPRGVEDYDYVGGGNVKAEAA